MRSLVIGAALAAGLAPMALAQIAPSGRDLAPLVQAYETRLTTLQQTQKAMPPPAELAEAVDRLKTLDGAVRNGLEMRGLSRPDALALQKAINPIARKVEAANTAELKAITPPGGWFRTSVHGQKTSDNAWVILQHSSDRAWQKEVLDLMKPMLAVRDVNPQSYAMLFDEVHLAETGKQRFGTQAVCREGRMVIADMDEPERVQERRDAIGFTQIPFAAFKELYADMTC